MNIKTLNIVAAIAVATSATLPSQAATPQVTSVIMMQPGPTRLVNIDYTFEGADAVITLDVQTNAPGGAWASIGGAAVCNAQGDVWKKVTNDSSTHHITWRPDLSWPDHIIADGGARAVITAWALDNTPDYMVVDISAGAKPNTQKYYPSADFVPFGVTNGAYKTSKLLLRKIMAKDVEWTMGSTVAERERSENEATHQVTLTNNYYIGVYEVTQSQWGEVTAASSSAKARFAVEGSMRPMEMVSYTEIRYMSRNVANDTATWISGGTHTVTPASDSFLGLLRLKSGLDFDLPSEAEWEFAARAGHGSGYWNDGSPLTNTDSDTNLCEIARFKYSNPGGITDTETFAPSQGGTAVVGSYKPNDWGLYDMCGNVWELCLDWMESNIATATDTAGKPYNGRVNISPADPSLCLSGNSAPSGYRVRRGGAWNTAYSSFCRLAKRQNADWPQRYKDTGFRLVIPLQ